MNISSHLVSQNISHGLTATKNFLTNNKLSLTIVTAGLVSALAIAILAFPPVALALGAIALTAKISLVALPVGLKIAMLVGIGLATVAGVAGRIIHQKREESREFEYVGDAKPFARWKGVTEKVLTPDERFEQFYTSRS